MKFDSTEIKIRNLAESDLAAVISLAELLEEAPHWPPEVYSSLIHPESSFDRIALVAFERRSGQLLGFTVARRINPEAELETIAVGQEFQRRGIARCLLSELATELRNGAFDSLHLEVRASNSSAIALYNSFGFIETGRRTRYYSGPVKDAILMKLKLT